MHKKKHTGVFDFVVVFRGGGVGASLWKYGQWVVLTPQIVHTQKEVILGRIVSVLLLCVSLLRLGHITVIIPIPKDIILRNDSISILFCSEDFASGRESCYAHKIVF